MLEVQPAGVSLQLLHYGNVRSVPGNVENDFRQGTRDLNRLLNDILAQRMTQTIKIFAGNIVLFLRNHVIFSNAGRRRGTFLKQEGRILLIENSILLKYMPGYIPKTLAYTIKPFLRTLKV